MWEVMTMAKLPYSGIPIYDLFLHLKREHRLQRPDECPQEM